jgi:hypothetical protein
MRIHPLAYFRLCTTASQQPVLEVVGSGPSYMWCALCHQRCLLVLCAAAKSSCVSATCLLLGLGIWCCKAGWVDGSLQQSVAGKPAGPLYWVCLCSCAEEHLYPMSGMHGGVLWHVFGEL